MHPQCPKRNIRIDLSQWSLANKEDGRVSFVSSLPCKYFRDISFGLVNFKNQGAHRNEHLEFPIE